MRTFFLILLLLTSNTVWGLSRHNQLEDKYGNATSQKEDVILSGRRRDTRADPYRAIDHLATQVPVQYRNDLDVLTDYLVKNYQTDIEKARIIYAWIQLNILYDDYEYRTQYETRSDKEVTDCIETGFGSDCYKDTPYDTFKKRSGVCRHFAKLFVHMARRAGLNAIVVNGFAFNGAHAWNAVQINNEWQLLDSTSARRTNTGVQNDTAYLDKQNAPKSAEQSQYVKTIDNRYFLIPPEKMIKSHYPENPGWQLLDPPLTPKEAIALNPEYKKNEKFIEFVREYADEDEKRELSQQLTANKTKAQTAHSSAQREEKREVFTTKNANNRFKSSIMSFKRTNPTQETRAASSQTNQNAFALRGTQQNNKVVKEEAKPRAISLATQPTKASKEVEAAVRHAQIVAAFNTPKSIAIAENYAARQKQEPIAADITEQKEAQPPLMSRQNNQAEQPNLLTAFNTQQNEVAPQQIAPTDQQPERLKPVATKAAPVRKPIMINSVSRARKKGAPMRGSIMSFNGRPRQADDSGGFSQFFSGLFGSESNESFSSVGENILPPKIAQGLSGWFSYMPVQAERAWQSVKETLHLD